MCTDTNLMKVSGAATIVEPCAVWRLTVVVLGVGLAGESNATRWSLFITAMPATCSSSIQNTIKLMIHNGISVVVTIR
jgi:hypothetical protein